MEQTAGSYSVLAVDDSAFVLRAIARQLEGTEFRLTGTARDGAEALARHAELNPQVILLDIVMPGATGVEVLKTLRAAGATARIVMASSLGMEETVLDCLTAGADSFLQKPFTSDLLLTVLRRAVGAPRVTG